MAWEGKNVPANFREIQNTELFHREKSLLFQTK